ncbi:glycosyl hydrolase catalytic core-domain-containing protein [Panaeolus papilionaceus]|nr:glycosyl hydrolase catalytic core-domain-containing protein [Panaeolus papilionaceus]
MLAGHASARHIKPAHRYIAHHLPCHAHSTSTSSSHSARLKSTQEPLHPTSSTLAVAPSAVSSIAVHSTTADIAHGSSSTKSPTSTHTISPIRTSSVSTASTKTVKNIATPTSLAKTLTPNSIKAGIAGGDAYPFVKDHIGWWYDWSPKPSKPGSPIAVPMLWGNGTVDKQDADRLVAFEHLSTVPPYVLGFEEPDCPSGSGSAGMTVDDAVAKWQSLIVPLGKKGAKLGSPSMCKQIDETWLAEFAKKISTPWDFTAVHINKNSMDGVVKVIEHYMTYGKPIWVTEFACVNDHDGFTPCTDQGEINQFIDDIVDYLQNNDQVYAYAYSNGLGLGDVWPMMNGNSLSESGKRYLAAISKYH